MPTADTRVMANPIDILAAKAKGIENSMHARREGLVGVFQTLAKQHGEAGALIDKINSDAGKRESLWPKLRVALMAHEHGELEAVYPALARYPELKQFVDQHAKEANELDGMIKRLDGMSPESDEWASVFSSLGSAVVAHAGEEENEIFPVALNAIGADRAKELDRAFKEAHDRIETTAKRASH
jgi:hypothetical protein